MWKTIYRQWFLILLLGSLALGFGFPAAIRPFAESSLLRAAIVSCVLLLMGLTLHPAALSGSVRRPWPALLAIAVNVFVVPLVAMPALWILPPELAGGLIVAALVPCTLASCVVWTRKAGGEEGVALIVSVVTNLGCFIVAPIGLALLLSQTSSISATEQARSLLMIVVLPLLAGQLLRRLGLAVWADQNRLRLSILMQLGILIMVAFGSVASADRMASQQALGATGPAVVWILATLVAAAMIHCIAAAVAWYAAKLMRATRGEMIAASIAGSQKTLMVGLQLALDCGVSVLPMIFYHVGQLLIDTALARRWARQSRELRDPQKETS